MEGEAKDYADMDPAKDNDSIEDEYTASVRVFLMSRRGSKRSSLRYRRTSSPYDPELVSRRPSFNTSESIDSAFSAEDTQANEEVTQEQIFSSLNLHKEFLTTLKHGPWSMRKKLKLVQQAKCYIKDNEGALQSRLAQSKSTRDMLTRFNILLATKLQRVKREAANLSNLLIPWERRIKEIESHFGSAVASYFTFLRWLFLVNLIISAVLVMFVIVPEVLTGDTKEGSDRKNVFEEERNKSTNLLTLWEFEGVLKVTPIFYGYYTNMDAGHGSYRLPFAYFFTGLAVYVYSFVATLKKMAQNSRMSKLSEKEDECAFSWKLFTGWDYMIGNAETAHNRTASIILGFKEALLEEAEKRKDPRNWKIISLRCIANMCVLVLLIVSAYAVVFVVDRSKEHATENDLWRQNEITIVMSLISFTFPIFFELLGLMEHYHPRKQLRIQLGRIMLLNLLNLYSLIFATFGKIDGITTMLETLKPQNPILSRNDSNCAKVQEPTTEFSFINFGQECYKEEISCQTWITTDYVASPPLTITDPRSYFKSDNPQNLNLYTSDTTHSSTTILDPLESEILKLKNMYPFSENETEDTLSQTYSDIDYGDYKFDNMTFPIYDDNLPNYHNLSSQHTTEFNQNDEYELTTSLDTVLYDKSVTFLTPTATASSSNEVLATIYENHFSTPMGKISSLPENHETTASYFQTSSSTLTAETNKIWLYAENSTKTTCFKVTCLGSDDPKVSTISETHTENQNHDTTPNPFKTLPIDTRRDLWRSCWETMFGQELVKLTMMDLVMTILGTLFLDFFRALIVRALNKCWCWDLEKKFPQYGDFKIAENILHLVNNQGMVWMGMFFSPGLVLINLIKLVIIMYLRSWAVMTCNVPHQIVFRASRSNNFYLALLLTMLFLCVLPVGYAIVWVKPSWHCGPFSNYDRIYHILTKNLNDFLPVSLKKAADYISSPGIVIPLLVLLVLIIYYLTSLTNSLREANNDLKLQLRRERTEERRKVFKMADLRKNDGSPNIEHSAFNKWKKITMKLGKSYELDYQKNSEEVTSNQNQGERKTGDLLAKIVKMALNRVKTQQDVPAPLKNPASEPQEHKKLVHGSSPTVQLLNERDNKKQFITSQGLHFMNENWKRLKNTKNQDCEDTFKKDLIVPESTIETDDKNRDSSIETQWMTSKDNVSVIPEIKIISESDDEIL